jgi:hypothetical protein
MSRSLLALVLLLALAGTSVSDEKKPTLEVTLSLPKKELAKGEKVTFSARLKNVSEKPVGVIGCLDGSDFGRRSPKYLASATRDGKPHELPKPEGFCGFKNPLKAKEVRVLGAGEELDPFGTPFFSHYQLHEVAFDEPGKYELVLTYDADTAEDAWFLQDGDEDGARRLREVARIRVSSAPLVFTVK